MQIARVIPPLDYLDVHTYGVPVELAEQIQPGMRVAVQIRQKIVIGLVLKIENVDSEEVGQLYPLQFIVEDSSPLIPVKQLAIWEWIAKYYMCNLGTVMNYALPSTFIPELKTWIYLNKPQVAKELSLEAHQIQIFLQQKPRTLYADFLKKFSAPKYAKVFDELYQSRVIDIQKEIKSKYQPIYEPALGLHNNYQDLADSEILANYQGQKNLLAVLQIFLKLYVHNQRQPIPLRTLTEHAGKNIRKHIAKLENDGILQELEIQRSRIQNIAIASNKPKLADLGSEILPELSPKPTLIISEYSALELLELYYGTIKELLNRGQQVLFIYPEDQLPSQAEKQQLQSYYGAQILFYNKHNNVQERHELWEYIRQHTAQLICTDGSGLHLPFTNLGAVFMAGEPSHTRRRVSPPYLNNRDLALYTAQIWNVPICLFSSMPSSDSIYQVELKKYNYRKITPTLPIKQVEIQHISLQQYPPTDPGNCLSAPILHAIKQAKADDNSIFLFQNRIGYAPYIMCKSCNWIAKCRHCNASLTYFKKKHELRCRYCGKQYQVYPHCPVCFSGSLEERKFGTEKVEISLEKLFPEYHILRFDKETLKHKTNYREVIDMLKAGVKVDIFVGTTAFLPLLRNISISTVAVLDTNSLLQTFDFNFRDLENGFRLLLELKELLTRSKHPRPQLLLQQFQELDPEQRQLLENGNFLGFINNELNLRKQFNLPPICKMIRIQFLHKQEELAFKTANFYAQNLSKLLPNLEILGPNTPKVSKIRDEFIYVLHLKIPRSSFWNYQAKTELQRLAEKSKREYSTSTKIKFFIDP